MNSLIYYIDLLNEAKPKKSWSKQMVGITS
jgi:hypothetical protein